ncbi:competence protein CoiA family protein [Flavobacterium sp. 245]|uniref:competence protein CoiA family protein n=1 Tax=Flavobacterium sp. 245 TaxID=2512115 RepID=UPI00105DEF61|nr:competence protein CoiA family protein [Flavobacterium sp. 245]TDP00322.1 competence protein CoiA-like protein [Flavobacterium sp. 245]
MNHISINLTVIISTMQHAIDINGKKITPAYSGERAVCGFCKQEVIGKCGEIYIWHWQHVHNADCDLWKEGETKWHRDWKNKFPLDWQETIIEKNSEKHIADIFTPNGIVIEFQNSMISSSIIAEREKFYEKMIWVINAQTFKDNLITENISDQQLAEIDRRYSAQRSLLSKHNSFGLQNTKKKQNVLTTEIQSREDALKGLESVTDLFKSYNKNAETFAEQIIITWQSENLFVDPSLIEIISDDAIPAKKSFFRLLRDLKRNKHFLSAALENSVEIEELYKERNEILNEIENLKPALKEELKSVASQHLNREVEIAQLKREILFLKWKNTENDKELEELKISIDNYIKTNLKKIEADFDEERNKILKDKNKLTLSWKRERKSWGSAAAPIFFDIGDGYLLYKHPNNKASRVKVCDFMSKYNPGER